MRRLSDCAMALRARSSRGFAVTVGAPLLPWAGGAASEARRRARRAAPGLLALASCALAPLGCSEDSNDGSTPGSVGMSGAGFAAGGSDGSQGGSDAAGSAGTNGAMAGSSGAQGGSAGSATTVGTAGAIGLGGMSAGGAASMTAAEVCPAGAVFCDDFEDDATGQGPGDPWRNDTNGATVNVETQRAFSGTNAVHVTAPTGAAYRRGYFALDQGSSANVFPALAQEMYGRAMMWLEEAPDTAIHWTFIQGEGTSGTMPPHNRLYRYGGQQQGGLGLMANFETTTIATDCWDHSEATMPTGTWACVEWRFAVATNEMQFWLNGEELEDIHVIGSGEGCIGNALNGQWLAPPAFQTLYLGWEHYQPAGNDINLWVDAVAVSNERLGCPAAP